MKGCVLGVGGGGDSNTKMPVCVCQGYENRAILNGTFSQKYIPINKWIPDKIIPILVGNMLKSIYYTFVIHHLI